MKVKVYLCVCRYYGIRDQTVGPIRIKSGVMILGLPYLSIVY